MRRDVRRKTSIEESSGLTGEWKQMLVETV